jgi:RNA polymerase sigma-70 factor (ECF subfamily)
MIAVFRPSARLDFSVGDGDDSVMPDAPASDPPLPMLSRVAAGDRGAMRDCIDRYGGMVWSLARRLCPTEAEDAVQDIFVELWRKAGLFDPGLASEPTFVAMIARRRLVDRWRRAGRRPPGEPLESVAEPPSRQAGAEERLEISDEAARAAEAMGRLSDPQRQVLRMSIHDGLSYPEISQRTGWPLGTVKTHARRGLMRLRELLGAPAEGIGAASAAERTEGLS